jgi:hypothetical protein
MFVPRLIAVEAGKADSLISAADKKAASAQRKSRVVKSLTQSCRLAGLAPAD